MDSLAINRSAARAAERLSDVFRQLTGIDRDDRHIFTRFYRKTATAEATAADLRAKRGESLGRLDGRIVSIKDLFDVEGEPTLAGGQAFPGVAPAPSDATIVAQARQAGAVIVGKTNMTEFAFSGLGLNPHYGTPANACDPARIPGGSSSGAAISVALGLAEIAIGSDTGGSVRIPAAFNRLVGFKPGQGRISRRGMSPLSFSLDCIGFITANVDDAAAAYETFAEDDSAADEPSARLRLGIPRGFLFSEMDDEVALAFGDALKTLSRAGHTLVDVDLDDILGRPFDLQQKGTLVGAEAAFIHTERLAHPNLFDPFVLARIRKGQALDAATYVGILQHRSHLLPQLDASMRDLDALVVPTVPIIAPQFADLASSEALDRTNALVLRNTSVFNFFDLPALSLPVPTTRSVHAVGCMLVGRRGRDRQVLAVAQKLQALFRIPGE